MSKNNYDDLDELYSDLIDDITEIIENNVKDEVIGIAESHVQSDVLDVYNPKFYKRRSDKNSKNSLKNSWDATINNGKNTIGLTIENTAKAFNKNFEDFINNIEEGYGKQDQVWNQPRPFMDKIQEEVNNDDEIDSIVDKNLDQKGW